MQECLCLKRRELPKWPLPRAAALFPVWAASGLGSGTQHLSEARTQDAVIKEDTLCLLLISSLLKQLML